MKTPVASLLVLACACFASPSAAENTPAYPSYAVPHSELRVLPISPTGRHYQLYVGLPTSYAKETTRRYPVVYVTDAYWDFQKITAIEGGLVYDKYAPEFITVGIGYAGDNLDYDTLRRWELTPAPYGRGGPESSGHAADFLKTIETEVIPFVEREYRADPSYRVMCGASLGGLFTLYAMYSKPELFNAFVAATPAVIVANDWLLGYEDSFFKAKKPLHTRLFMSSGGNESPNFFGGQLRMNQRIASRKYDGLAYEYRIVDGERHAGMQFESYERGLRFAFAPLAPESGPSR